MKKVFITGANGGIGKALCKKYSHENYVVVASDLHEKCNHDYCSDYISIDLNKMVENDSYRSEIKTSLVKLEIDILINNAACQVIEKFENFSFQMWQESINTNLSSVFALIKMFYNNLKLRRGQIINIASIHSHQTKPEFFAYATSKAGLVGLTKSLALEFKGDITVNAISPAAIDTLMLNEGFNHDQSKIDKLKQLHPSGIIGSPEGLSNLIYQITNSNNRFLNGSIITFDGGISNALLDLET